MPLKSLSRQSHNVQRPITVSECRSCHLLQWRRNTQLNGWDENTLFLVVESFKIVGPAVPFFWQTNHIFHFIYLGQNIRAFHLFFKKRWPLSFFKLSTKQFLLLIKKFSFDIRAPCSFCARPTFCFNRQLDSSEDRAALQQRAITIKLSNMILIFIFISRSQELQMLFHVPVTISLLGRCLYGSN